MAKVFSVEITNPHQGVTLLNRRKRTTRAVIVNARTFFFLFRLAECSFRLLFSLSLSLWRAILRAFAILRRPFSCVCDPSSFIFARADVRSFLFERQKVIAFAFRPFFQKFLFFFFLGVGTGHGIFFVLAKEGGMIIPKRKRKIAFCVLSSKYIYMLHKVTFLFSLNSLKPCN